MIDLSNKMEQAVLIADLADIAADLPRRDNILAGKMIRAFDYWGGLTAGQEAAVRHLLTFHGAHSDCQ